MIKSFALVIPALLLSVAAQAGSVPTATAGGSTAVGNNVMPASVTAALQDKSATADNKVAGPGTASITVGGSQAAALARDIAGVTGATVTRDAAGNITTASATVTDNGATYTVTVNTDTGVLTVTQS